MEIKVAASAGFCFGVKRAVELVEKLVSEGKKVCTLGAIIHNPQKVQELAEKGVRIVSAIEEVMPKETLVIRSHGVGASVIDSIEQAGIAYENATCPFVQKIHRIVSEHSRQGEIILIAGDKDHPEVQGIIGHCFSACYTFMNEEELTEIIEKVLSKKKEPVCVVVQTTFNEIEWKKSLKILQKVCTNAKIFDTICSATSDRQSEAEILASESDLMLVIGGRHSSNTNKLFQICRDKCSQTYLIETAGELPVKAVTSAHRIGITAGASTPASIIKEVLVTMTEEIKNITESEAEENFKTLYEESVIPARLSKPGRGVCRNTVCRPDRRRGEIPVPRRQAVVCGRRLTREVNTSHENPCKRRGDGGGRREHHPQIPRPPQVPSPVHRH